MEKRIQITLIENNISQLQQVCEQYHVSQLFIIGSVVKGNARPDSDIDLVAYFLPDIALEDYADNFFDFIYALEDIFNKKIDLISGKAMKNPYFIEEVERTKMLVYEQPNKKIAV